jgi:hypothetical protein
LDNNGIESSVLDFSLFPAKTKNKKPKNNSRIFFYRSEIAFKTCGNNWSIIHIAQSAFWPRLISSKPKLIIQAFGGDYMCLKNEVRSCNYSKVEDEMCRFAEAVFKESAKQPA